MGKIWSKRKRDKVNPKESEQAEPEDPGLQRIRITLEEDLEKFLLNNILLSVQFFQNFEREVKNMRTNLESEGDADRKKGLAEHQRYCITPDRLYDVVRRRVLFRHAHGERSRSYELLHSPRLMVVQENIEVVEKRDEAVYATVTGTHNYRFVMEPTTNNRPGYVRLRAEEYKRPHNRRVTYETIQDEDEGVYTSIHSPNESDSARSTIQEQVVESDNNSSPPETRDLTETESAGNGPPFHVAQSAVTDSTQEESKKTTRKVFGPQNPNCDPINESIFTPTERRLSGIRRMPKYDARPLKKNPGVLRAAQSTPNLAAIQSPKDSGSSGYKSDCETEYGYTTITEITRPRLLKEYRLGYTSQNTSEIPEQCFHEISVPLHEDEEEEEEEESGNMKRRQNLFLSRYYVNSDFFSRNFADIFADKIGALLGLTSALNSATTQGSKIYCDTTEIRSDSRPLKIRREIVPTLFSATWPKEALQRKARKRRNTLGSETSVQNSWPTQDMINEMKNCGCHLLPVGYMPTRGRNVEQYLEWQLAFPEAERYLETHLTHGQVRCLLFTMALYKTFLEPLNTQLGLLPIHIRTVLFWQSELNCWPEDRPGEILHYFLGKLYNAIMHRHLEDFFIEKRNLFESIPRTHLLKVQEKLLRIRENLVMHVLLALRNLRYIDTAFYPMLDYKKLYDIIISHENLVPNPQPQQPMIDRIIPKNKQSKQQSEEEESEEETIDSNADLWKDMKEDKERKWKKEVRKQIEIERVAQKLNSKAKTPAVRQRKLSTDSIDIKLRPKTSADKQKITALLRFFIPHFLEIAHKSSQFNATKQARFYQQHAERLQILLREYDEFRKEDDFSREFKMFYSEMDKESTAQSYKQTQLPETSTKAERRRSVHFLKSTPSQDHMFNNGNPFRKKMNPPPFLSSTKTYDEQSQPNTNIVTHAQVYEPNTRTTTRTHPNMSTSPESRTDVTDNPRPPHNLMTVDDIMVESTES